MLTCQNSRVLNIYLFYLKFIFFVENTGEQYRLTNNLITKTNNFGHESFLLKSSEDWNKYFIPLRPVTAKSVRFKRSFYPLKYVFYQIKKLAVACSTRSPSNAVRPEAGVR